MSVLTVAQVKNHLLGITPYITAAINDPTNEAAFYQEVIDDIEDRFERRTRILLTNRTIVMSRDAQAGELSEDPFNLRRAFARRNPRFQLRRRPITEVTLIRFQFGEDTPVLTIPEAWQRVNYRLGIVDIVPFTESAAIVTGTGASLWLPFPFVGSATWPGDTIPKFVAIDYKAGYTDAATNTDLNDLRGNLARWCALGTLLRARNLIPNSVQLEGFTQNFDSVEQRIERLRKEVDAWLTEFETRERAMVVGVIG